MESAANTRPQVTFSRSKGLCTRDINFRSKRRNSIVHVHRNVRKRGARAPVRPPRVFHTKCTKCLSAIAARVDEAIRSCAKHEMKFLSPKFPSTLVKVPLSSALKIICAVCVCMYLRTDACARQIKSRSQIYIYQTITNCRIVEIPQSAYVIRDVFPAKM